MISGMTVSYRCHVVCFRVKNFVAMKVVKSAQHYTEIALDEIKLLRCVSRPVLHLLPVYTCTHRTLPVYTCTHCTLPVYTCIHHTLPVYTCIHCTLPVYTCIHCTLPVYTCTHTVPYLSTPVHTIPYLSTLVYTVPYLYIPYSPLFSCAGERE